MKFLRRQLLALWYGYEMTLAYLAEGMGDKFAMANHENFAKDVIQGKYDKEGVQ